jgi:hypothetical protein
MELSSFQIYHLIRSDQKLEEKPRVKEWIPMYEALTHTLNNTLSHISHLNLNIESFNLKQNHPTLKPYWSPFI